MKVFVEGHTLLENTEFFILTNLYKKCTLLESIYAKKLFRMIFNQELLNKIVSTLYLTFTIS